MIDETAQSITQDINSFRIRTPPIEQRQRDIDRSELPKLFDDDDNGDGDSGEGVHSIINQKQQQRQYYKGEAKAQGYQEVIGTGAATQKDDGERSKPNLENAMTSTNSTGKTTIKTENEIDNDNNNEVPIYEGKPPNPKKTNPNQNRKIKPLKCIPLEKRLQTHPINLQLLGSSRTNA